MTSHLYRQPQYSYLLVSELIQQLDNTQSESSDYLEKRASFVSALDAILNANVSLVGISVLEVLNSLFAQLIQSLHDSNKKFMTSKDDNSLHYFIHQGLVQSIGGLASQTYYVNQLNDITSSIVSKLRINHADTTIEGLSIVEYRRATIQCLQHVVVCSAKKSEREGDAPVYNHSISLDTLIPALGLLLDTASGINKIIQLV